jgi:ferredoxin--NADP+ reductase
MSSAYAHERVLEVHHWNDTLFSFKAHARPRAALARNGHFVMIGLEVEGKPLTRAYSIVSANHEEFLEFLSIKVPRRSAHLAPAAPAAGRHRAGQPQARRHAGRR